MRAAAHGWRQTFFFEKKPLEQKKQKQPEKHPP
jgi:hypothetical protein